MERERWQHSSGGRFQEQDGRAGGLAGAPIVLQNSLSAATDERYGYGLGQMHMNYWYRRELFIAALRILQQLQIQL